jgi:hypothetical protein
MVPEQNYEETDRLEMLLLRQDVLSDFLLDTWKADFKTSSKWRAIPNVDPHSLLTGFPPTRHHTLLLHEPG